MTRIIAELGSCHMSKLERIKEAIDRCKKIGVDALKLQLFPNEAPYVPTNIWLDPYMMREAIEYGDKHGVIVSASVFDELSWIYLLDSNPKFIKFSYSKKESSRLIAATIQHDIEAIVSCDVMTDHLVPKEATKLYCIPEYPVRYEIAFDGLFGESLTERIPNERGPARFDGFSDHTLGIRQTQRAIDAGATVIEKHVRLGYDDETCPDARFAVVIEELGKLRR